MSKSRLEKFLYALYSMDSSDLPNPLSRIEELYKCWVTGEEVPTFEPISRTEKYLMAILGVYDVNELPNPISRVEVLLHKLAIGDDNLDDIKSFLSEHEELLAEIIRNGGVGGNIDIEYVLYTLSTEHNTLYNTAEKPVKSAFLKGNTLVNLSPFTNKIALSPSNTSEIKKVLQTLNQNTKYILIFNINNSTSSLASNYIMVRGYNTVGAFKEYGRTIKNFGNGRHYILLESTQGNVERIFIGSDFSCEIDDTILAIYQDGMENWDIPYFEGMKSVQMPVLTTVGKNLFDGEYELDKYLQKDGTLAASADWATTKNYIRVKPNTTYTQNIHMNSVVAHVVFYDKNKNIIGAEKGLDINKYATYTTPNNCYYIKTCYKYSAVGNHLFQIEEGSIATSYEPFKSNILTVNEDVELRGIGEVKDELDLLTGEVTERIGEVVLNGSEGWYIYTFGAQDNVISFMMNDLDNKRYGVIACDKLRVVDALFEGNALNAECIVPGTASAGLTIYISKDKVSDVETLKQYLSQNPLTVQYQLATESVKTVDLSVVDQDGNNTELSTFDDLTHVTLSSEGLIPEAELEVEVAEKVTEVAASMISISRDQEVIDTTTNEQSENVDATMIATTEIYEGLL